MLTIDETGGGNEDCCASTELLAKTAQREGGQKHAGVTAPFVVKGSSSVREHAVISLYT
jgi:hypothetical protein